VACLAFGDNLGPSFEDGRVLLVREGLVYLLDPMTGQRTPLRLSDTEAAEQVFTVSPVIHGVPPLPLDEPTIVYVFASNRRGFALLDPVTATIRRAPESTSGYEWISTAGATGLALDAGQRLVRHDFRTDVTEELFSVDELD
jgi:hypothetical protein